MRPARRAALACLAALCLAAPPLAAQDRGRTFYDRLPLDTPEHAARAFVDAYAASDFWTVYLILSPAAQDVVQRSINVLDLRPILRLDGPPTPAVFARLVPTPSEWEQSQDFGWLFDHMMRVARDTGLLPIRIDPAAAIGPPDGTQPHVTVQTASGPLVLELVRSPAGRWRVGSAIPPGRPRDHPPWGLP